MKIRLSPISLTASLCALLAVGSGGLLAQQDIPDVDTPQMLEALEKLKETQRQSAKSSVERARQLIEAAASSPGNAIQFYAKAHMETGIVGRNRENTEFRDWKEKQEAILDSPEVRRAMQIHLAYLALTLRRAGGAEVEELLPDLVSYSSTLFTMEDLRESRNGDAKRLIGELLDKPVGESIFVRWFQIGDALQGLEEWEMSPGKADAIVEKTVLPEFRRQKDSRLLKYWDDRILREQAVAVESKLSFRISTFENVRKPELLWNRAKEYQAVGLPNRAVSEMFAIVQKYPAHQDADQWIEEIESILKPVPPGDTAAIPGED